MAGKICILESSPGATNRSEKRGKRESVPRWSLAHSLARRGPQGRRDNDRRMLERSLGGLVGARCFFAGKDAVTVWLFPTSLSARNKATATPWPDPERLEALPGGLWLPGKGSLPLSSGPTATPASWLPRKLPSTRPPAPAPRAAPSAPGSAPGSRSRIPAPRRPPSPGDPAAAGQVAASIPDPATTSHPAPARPARRPYLTCPWPARRAPGSRCLCAPGREPRGSLEGPALRSPSPRARPPPYKAGAAAGEAPGATARGRGGAAPREPPRPAAEDRPRAGTPGSAHALQVRLFGSQPRASPSRDWTRASQRVLCSSSAADGLQEPRCFPLWRRRVNLRGIGTLPPPPVGAAWRVQWHRARPSPPQDGPSGANPGWSWGAGSPLLVQVLPIPGAFRPVTFLTLVSTHLALGSLVPGRAPPYVSTSTRAEPECDSWSSFFLGKELSKF